jgi:hypothetical protein
MFTPYQREKFGIGDSFAIIGRSGSGKSVTVEKLLCNFSANFSVAASHCRTVIILYKVLQPTYQRILAVFPGSTRKILARSVDRQWLESGFLTSQYVSEQDYSLIIFDDCMEALAAKNSAELELLSQLLFVGLHHARALLLVTLQSLGTSDSSKKLRNLAKNFTVYILLSGLPTPTVRYLSGFLSPFSPTALVGLMNALPRTSGAYILIDNRLRSRHRFSAGSILSSAEGQIYMIFD